MKIRFVNFRCYIDETFDFSNNELILISAESGAGKSTILLGIQFCLYGTGSKLQNYGKPSCTVEMEFEDMKIVRTKRPNRLVLNDLYEDEIAQNIINKKFGDAFNVTSYICQNALNSFILMSPPDKLEFLETFAFKDVNLPEIKNKSKKICISRNEELNKTISQLEIAVSILKEIDEPIKVEFPFKCKSTDYEKFSKNEDVKVKNSDILIKKFSSTINKTQKELNDLYVLNSYIESKKDIFDSLSNKMVELLLEEKKIVYIGDEKLSEYKNILNDILSNKELFMLENKVVEDTKTFETMKQTEIEKCNNDIKNIAQNLWKDYTEEECKNSILETKDILKDAKKISFLKKQIKHEKSIDIIEKKQELENLRSDLDLKKQYLDSIRKQKMLYECPSCKNSLCFKDNKLYVTIDKIQVENNINEIDVKKEVNNIIINIKNLECIIPEEENKVNSRLKIEKEIDVILSQYEDELDESSLQEDIDTLESYYNTQKKLESRKDGLEIILQNKNFSTSYTLFEKDLSKLEIKLRNLRNKCGKTENTLGEESLRSLIIEAQFSQDSQVRIINKRKDIESDTLKYTLQVESMKNTHNDKYESIKDISYLKDIISSSQDKIEESQTKKEIALKNVDQIDNYNKYNIEKDKYKIFKEKVSDLEEKEKEDKKKYTAALFFKEKILEAESIAMQNIVDCINTHAQIYLDYFFPDNPINVKLMCFKETKKNNKPQINIEIDYKGMEADLSMLSGGETSRVVLAFTLALGEMFNTPLLLLDECTSSLNQELTTVVFDSIKEHFKTKKVIVVAHQVIEGVFDKIIKLK